MISFYGYVKYFTFVKAERWIAQARVTAAFISSDHKGPCGATMATHLEETKYEKSDTYWVVPPPSNSHHQDYYLFSRGSRAKPSFATVTRRGGNPTYSPEILEIMFSCGEFRSNRYRCA